MRSGNNFYDVDGMKNKNEQMVHQMNPFFRNNMVHAAQQHVVPVAVRGGDKDCPRHFYPTVGVTLAVRGDTPTAPYFER